MEGFEFAFEIEIKIQGAGTKAFAALGLVGGLDQVFVGDDAGPEIAVAFHDGFAGGLGCGLSCCFDC